ncbi:MAG TPA: FtsX-like permease family protein [Pyrinomonadaceae bacterium]|nr:FtsX-like permease family protein [Pyrinomonadaceae bacterium]
MRTGRLIQRSLAYYWQTNLVVVLGVAIAVAVLTGALLIGESVRGSLRDLVSQRLGRTDDFVASTGFFREQLATDILQPGTFTPTILSGTCPLIALDGLVTHEPSRRRAGDVRVYGVDERFWKFNGVAVEPPQDRQVLLSESLAHELGTTAGDSILLRIEKPSDIPIESLHGRKEDPGRTIRLNLKSVLPAASLGEFSLRPQQGPVRAIFVSLPFLQKELDQTGNVNTFLISRSSPIDDSEKVGFSYKIETLLKDKATLEDFGLKLRVLDEQKVLSLESSSNIINDTVANAAQEAANASSLKTVPVLSYLANSISLGDRSVPYSLVTGLDDEPFMRVTHERGPSVIDQYTGRPCITINDWTARELNAHLEDIVTLEYYLWQEGGRLETKKAEFAVCGIAPIAGLAADRDLVPAYPGITESENMSDWDPPFPIDLARVRRQDEDYWHQYRTTPKAFIPLSNGQKLWQTRFGKLTSIRLQSNNGQPASDQIDPFQKALREKLSPSQMGFQIVPVREQGLQASRGATDFGEYFLYFSFFLVVSALLLTALFFKLGIEQRLREIGTLQALGFSAGRIRWLFLAEGVLLAIIGSLLGVLGAIGYAKLLMYGLKTWWVGAVGTTALVLHVSWQSMLIGAVGGVVAAVVCVVLTLRKLGSSSTRGLMLGESPKGTRIFWIGIGATVVGLVLLGVGALHVIPQVAGFFGGGVVLLVASVCFLSAWLKRKDRKSIQGTGWWTIWLLGFRNAAYRPSRTVLCVTLIASAAFIIVAVDAFRRSGSAAADRKSGSGGFPLFAESLLPIVHDANTPAGREALNLNTTNDAAVLQDLKFVNFRVRPGDDTSCLNLYQPRNPKIIAPPASFVDDNRFTFQSSIEPNETNPWVLLNREFPDGAIPVITDANSLTYVLHLKVGDDFVIDHNGQLLRLRIVGALSDSIFQSELLMSDKNFVRLFPEAQGYRFFLLDTPQTKSQQVASVLEDRLSDFGFDTQSTAERLANFHRVENTYLSTFQLLGGLGLILGTLGMAAVLLRNVFERRRELALLRAVGYNSSHFAVMVISENVLMLCCGVAIGSICALLAIAPVFFERGGRLPNVSLGLLLLAVLVSGAIASLVATLAALRSPLLPALRAE